MQLYNLYSTFPDKQASHNEVNVITIYQQTNIKFNEPQIQALLLIKLIKQLA